MKSPKLLEASLLAIAIAPLLFLAAIWNSLPEQVPMHWGADGQINRWGSKWSVWMLPVIVSLPVYLLLKYAPKIDPKRNFEAMSDSYRKLRFILGIALSAIVCQLIYSTWKVAPMSNLLLLIIAALIAAIGNYLGTVKPNYFIGIRTPWTLENAENWRKTHRFASKSMFLGGIVAILAILFLPKKWVLPAFMGLVLTGSLLPVVYSFFIYQKGRNQTD